LPDRVSAAFSKRLKQAREMRGLSQRALGALVDEGKDKNRGAVRINRYEQQVNLANLKTAGELANALEVPLAFLFAESDELAELILAFERLSAEERAKVLNDLKRRASKQK
jgi:transcriptional regulator with XRE-family HTH domain